MSEVVSGRTSVCECTHVKANRVRDNARTHIMQTSHSMATAVLHLLYGSSIYSTVLTHIYSNISILVFVLVMLTAVVNLHLSSSYCIGHLSILQHLNIFVVFIDTITFNDYYKYV